MYFFRETNVPQEYMYPRLGTPAVNHGINHLTQFTFKLQLCEVETVQQI